MLSIGGQGDRKQEGGRHHPHYSLAGRRPGAAQGIKQPSGRHCQRKILNTRGGHGTPWFNPEKYREINGGEIRSRRAGKVFNFTLTMPALPPIADINPHGLECLLIANSGHRHHQRPRPSSHWTKGRQCTNNGTGPISGGW